MSELKMVALSASRIKTLESCSWSYWAQYHLKLPRIQNDGAKKGDVCHKIFEILLNQKHIINYNKIIKENDVCVDKGVCRLVKIYMRQNELNFDDEKLVKHIHDMILVGLKTDFYVKDGQVIKPEYNFEIVNNGPKYFIKGFIDKPAFRQGELIVDDFKSSKKQFSGEDHNSNIQALIYSLAAKKLWPDFKPHVRFIFLQYPDNPIQEIKYNDNVLKGFEYYLESIQKIVDNYSEKDARSNFAANQHVPSSGEFKGKLVCGFDKFKGELKKDGNIKWGCPYKWPFKYFIIKKDDKILYSVLNKDKVKLKEGEIIEEMEYSGCPMYNTTNVLNDIKIKTKKREYNNVLDLF